MQMHDFLTSPLVYNFIRGPLVWFSFIIFLGGSTYKIVMMLKLAQRDKVVFPYISFRYSMRSIFHWIIPFASTNWRRHPGMTVLTFLFHTCLLVTPVLLLAHNALLKESWDIRLWTLPETVADLMTIVVMLCCVIFVIRKMVVPEVRFVTYASDYLILAIAAAPFFTGFLAYHQLLVEYELMLAFHILAGEIMLIAIPFTRLSHMIYFWFTRAYTGSEFGAVRHSRDY
jgi:nitrate reductase gamma subunit